VLGPLDGQQWEGQEDAAPAKDQPLAFLPLRSCHSTKSESAGAGPLGRRLGLPMMRHCYDHAVVLVTFYLQEVTSRCRDPSFLGVLQFIRRMGGTDAGSIPLTRPAFPRE